MQQEPGIGMIRIPVFREESMIGLMGGMDEFRSLMVYMPNQEMTFAFSFNGIDTLYQQIVMGIFSILLNKDYDLPKFVSEN